MARAPRLEGDDRPQEEIDAARERFTDGSFVLWKNMTPEEQILSERKRLAYIAASRGDWAPGIALGLFPEDAGSR